MTRTADPLPSEIAAVEAMPLVSIVLPIRNESAYIERTLQSVKAQDYPQNRIELFVIDGDSTDDTKAIVERFSATYPGLQLLSNSKRIVPVALNMALRRVRGDVVIWLDGHCEVARDYVSRCVGNLASSGADCVGGPIHTVGSTYRAQAIAAGMSCWFGVGGSRFRTVKNRTLFVDTVAFPAYIRKAIERTGCFDEELVRNQDEEYNYRLRKLGGKILLASDIHSVYYGRSTFRSLWRQYFQYGFWKVRVLQKHVRQMQLRHFIPPVFVGAILVLSIAGFTSRLSRQALTLILVGYATANLLASVARAMKVGRRFLPALPLVFLILHVSYGLGFLLGLVRFGLRWGDSETAIRLETERLA